MDLENIFNEIEREKDAEVFSEVDLSTNEAQQEYQIQNDEQCDRILRWCLKRNQEIQENIEAAEKVKQEYIERVNSWLEKKNKKNIAANEFFMGRIEQYMASKFNGEKGTLKLLNGNIKYQKTPDKIEYDDEDNILKFLQENNYNDFIRTNPKINKVELKKQAKQVGTQLVFNDKVIPGISFIPQPMKVVISENKDTPKKSAADDIFL